MKFNKTLITALFGFTCFLFFPFSTSAAGAPTFTSTTPADCATSTAGTTVTIRVDSDDAIGAEHEVVMDWNQKLVGWWRYNTNGDLTDYSSYSNTITNNGATWSATGKYGGSYYFDSAADYMLASDSDLNITAADEYSISVWVKPSSTSHNKILQLGTDGSSGSYMGFLTGGPGQTVEYALRQNWNGDWTGVTSLATISSSTWNHIVLTNDGVNFRIYINGSLSNTSALGAFTNYTATFNLYIGKDIWSNYFEGNIDDVQFYKRTLSSGEISALYNGQNNQYTASFTPTSNGTYYYQGYTQDTSGNVTTTGQRVLYVGVTPPSYTLTYSAGSLGTISGSSTQSVVAGRTGSTITAVPNTGYSFLDWSDGLTTTQRTDTITTNTSYTANFTTSTYTLSYATTTGGSITGSSTQTVYYGESGTAISAVADSGYVFVRWDDGSTANPRTDLSVTDNISVSAVFSPVTTNNNNTNTGNSSIFVPSAPRVVIAPYFSSNNISSSILNVYQMAISERSDFSDSIWIPYSESYKTTTKTVYVKFRSPDGGESKSFLINPQTANQTSITSNSSIIYKFTRDLKLGMKGADVKELQKFLNNKGFLVDTTGVGAPGQESTYFGKLTRDALAKFQKANKIFPSAGYFGPVTRKIMEK